MRKTLSLFVLVGALALAVPPAYAGVELCGTDTDTLGATIVTFDDCFVDSTYILGDPITLTVNWTVDQGAALFEDFLPRGKKYTPNAKGNAAAGSDVTVLSFVDASAPGTSGSAMVSFSFSDLHPVQKGEVAQGTAHFVLILQVDEDGDGTAETSANFGVNVHVRSQM